MGGIGVLGNKCEVRGGNRRRRRRGERQEQPSEVPVSARERERWNYLLFHQAFLEAQTPNMLKLLKLTLYTMLLHKAHLVVIFSHV